MVGGDDEVDAIAFFVSFVISAVAFAGCHEFADGDVQHGAGGFDSGYIWGDAGEPYA